MVFAGVLIMALGATSLAARLERSSPRGVAPRVMNLVYALLGVALVLQFALDISDLAELPTFARTVIGVVVVSLPMLASGVVFATSLTRAGETDFALASNLVGALAGGLVEYLSMTVGFRALVGIAILFYGVAFVTRKKSVSIEAPAP